MFADKAIVYIMSGKGGDGHVSFRKEKFVPNGGPDGGDGGRGGDVWFEVDEGMNTLTDYRHIRKYQAQDGEPGGKRNCHGKDGKDIVLRVPEGTIIKEADSGQVIIDMSGETRRFKILNGGRGGNGNQHYATSSMQAPKYAQPGQTAKELHILMELKVIADVGLVGFPNVGKSTLLSVVTNARPKIANYHFTTIQPNLGVCDMGDGNHFVIADIPGLIEGASEGIGLGHEFLKHIERTRMIIHMVDGASVEGRDPVSDIYAINRELKNYSEKLASLPQIIVANKMDALGEKEQEEVLSVIRKEFSPLGIEVFGVSAVSNQGMKQLLAHVYDYLQKNPEQMVIFPTEYNPLQNALSSNEPILVSYDEENQEYVVEGVGIEKMLGYTSLDSEKGFTFFQGFLKDKGVLSQLEALGIQEGDTVRMYGLSFDYYK